MIALHQFEQIDGLLSSLLHMGQFETCDDPRGYIQTSNVLLDACIDAMGYEWTMAWASAEEAAAAIVARALTSSSFVGEDA